MSSRAPSKQIGLRRLRLLLIAGALLWGGCQRKHVPVEPFTAMPEPDCAGVSATSQPGASHVMRAGPQMRNREITEWYVLEPKDCLVVGRAHQRWRLATNEVEVVFDADLRPLTVVKKTLAQGRASGVVDLRRFDLRTPEVRIEQRQANGEVVHKILRGGRPEVIIAPGHGLLTAWIRRADLAVGEKTREKALDLRKQFEVIEDVTLRRDADRFEPSLGQTVRVYTIYGRESVFTDETNAVIGDLAGLRPFAVVEGEPAPPFPDQLADPR